MTTLHIAPLTACLALGGFPSPSTLPPEALREHAEQHPILISTEVFFGTRVQDRDGGEGIVADALVAAPRGKISALILQSGSVCGFDELRWNVEDKCFVTTQAPRPARSAGETAIRKETVLLSRLLDCPLLGQRRDEAGAREEIELGRVGGAFVDTRSGHVACVTTSVGGFLGIGAQSRVVPWTALEVVQQEGEYRLRSSCSPERLESAPRVGSGSDNLNNPEVRNALYSYFGTHRPEYEPDTPDRVILLPIDDLLGAKILRGSIDDDTLEDLMLDPASGQATLALCGNGGVVP